MRGVVIGDDVLIASMGSDFSAFPMHIGGMGIAPQGSDMNLALRRWVMYFDKITYSVSGNMQIGVAPESVPDFVFLMDEGVADIHRTMVDGFVIDGTGPSPIEHAIYEAYRAKEQESGSWALASGGGAPTFVKSVLPAADRREGRGFLVRLIDALPVPDGNIPLDDILRFKQRRVSELTALHVHLSEVYEDVLRSKDPNLAKRNAFDKLGLAVRDVQTVSSQDGIGEKRVSLDASFSLSDAVSAGVSSLFAGGSLTDSGAAFMAAGCGMAVTRSFGIGGKSGSNEPFAYCTSLAAEFRGR